jgi:endoglycosylceramidase
MTAMYGAVARRFAADPGVLGYDLLNEPWPGTTWTACAQDLAGCPGLDQSELGAFSAKAVTAIRGAGDHHLILGEPFVLFNFGHPTTSVPVPGGDPNAGLSFHLYTITTGAEPTVLSDAEAWSARTGGVLLNTEWGASQDPAAIHRQAGELDSALLPWLFWSFDGEMVPKLAAPPTGTNVATAAVDALTEAYPLAVAGTPAASSFDPTARTLLFSWSTARPAGGTYPAGTLTTFETPSSLYPAGYTVTGTGFTVTSAACAPTLTVTAQAGASSGSIRITPGGTCPASGG